ncbi:MAG: Dyp-type peroxidase [Acidimicrobiales bacterium]|jgi:deferrochelatase/peroxidase EfeB
MARLSRREFLGAGAAAVGAGAALAAGGGALGLTLADQASASTPFHGAHQAGAVQPPAPVVAILAIDVIASTRSELVDLLQTITQRARLLVEGGAPEDLGPASPPEDNGILGPLLPARQLTMVLGLGASLFDERFGLAGAMPTGLTQMTTFPNDNLDPTQIHGDLSVSLQADRVDTIIHAMRDITKHTRGAMQPRWRIDGVLAPPRPSGTPRNYLGFKDGIANPDVTKAGVANSLIWVQAGAGPAWTEGGTFQVVRVIRMLVEFWDRVSLQEQETMIGRRRDTGAPLDGNNQSDIPNYAADPQGVAIPLTAHMRLANPRTPATASSEILRRGWNYDRGIDVNGNLDQGLIFTCYQQDLKRQFEAVQTRLIGEPLVDYISPTGGGYFFVPPGAKGPSDYYASGLFATV